jgi:hypothetical protein
VEYIELYTLYTLHTSHYILIAYTTPPPAHYS